MIGGGHRRSFWAASSVALLLTAACSSEPSAPPTQRASAQSNAESGPAPCRAMPTQSYRWIAGGTLERGKDARLAEEAVSQSVKVAGFWMATHEVTNAEFAEFVRATGYVTLAERQPPALPNTPPEMQQAGSAVFTVPSDGNPNWWRWVEGANWRQPQGPSDQSEPQNARHPVVQIAYDDARAYAKWAGKALPSEEQWEWAARQGGADPDAPPEKQGQPSANTYQGSFPFADQGRDGYKGTAPVACFPADNNGLYDMIGNVWEWTSNAEDSERNIIKGGSYLCASNYCARYRPAARQFQERSLGTDHIGFRLVDPNRAAPTSAASAP